MSNLILKNFILEEFSFDNLKHLKLEKQIIESDGSNLISSDIDNYIKRNIEFRKKDNITNTYVISYQNKLIGLAFLNYHPEETRDNIILEEEIEIGLGLLPMNRDKHLGSKLEQEFSEKLLEMYPQFDFIVARINNENYRSIKAAKNAGFIHINEDEYHFNRK